MAGKRRIVYTNRPWEATGICSGCRLCELWCSTMQEAFERVKTRYATDLRAGSFPHGKWVVPNQNMRIQK